MKTRLQLKRDFDLIPFVHNELKLERDQVAQLALILFEAARRGDPQAQEAYRQAAYECSLIVQSLLKQLSFPRCRGPRILFGGCVQGGGFNPHPPARLSPGKQGSAEAAHPQPRCGGGPVCLAPGEPRARLPNGSGG